MQSSVRNWKGGDGVVDNKSTGRGRWAMGRTRQDDGVRTECDGRGVRLAGGRMKEIGRGNGERK